MCKTSARWIVACACLWAAAPAWGDGVILNGLSPRSLSRGGTNIAHFDNAAILHDNPAALVNVAGEGLFEIGVDMLITDFRYADPFNNVSDTTFTPLPQIGLVKKSRDGIWACGLGVYTPAGFTETYEMQGPFPLVGTQLYKSFGALMKVLPGGSVALTERLSVGGTFGVAVSHAELEGPYFLNGPGPLRGTPTLLDTQGTGAAPVWSAGLQYLLTDQTTIGVTYLSESSFALDGSTRVSVPNLGDTSYDSKLDVTWPQSVGLGVRHACCPHRIVSADVIWFNWSGAFDEFVLRLRNPSNPYFPEVDEHLPLAWRDTVSVRLGYEQQVTDCGTLRLGYVYHRNPIPSGTLTPFIQATLEHAVSVGYGWRRGDWSIDLGYMFLFGPDQHVQTSDLAGGDFDNSDHEARIHALLLGLVRHF